MELDDLKDKWQQSTNINKPNKNNNIMDLIQHKSYGPVAALKREFRKQMAVMLVFPIILLASNMDNIDKTFTNVLFWSYVAFCLGVAAFSYYNYQLVRKMEFMGGAVKSNLEQQILTLETRLKSNLVGIRFVLLYFIVLLEVLPYFQNIKMLNTWHSLSPLIRFGSYAAFLVFQYFLSRAVSKRKFGRHLAYLKELVKEMQ